MCKYGPLKLCTRRQKWRQVSLTLLLLHFLFSFQLPNEIFLLGLSHGALAVCSYLLYTIRPLQPALDQFYKQQLAQMDVAVERQRIAKALALSKDSAHSAWAISRRPGSRRKMCGVVSFEDDGSQQNEANVRTLHGDIPAALTDLTGKKNFCRTLCSQHMVFSGLIW